MGKPHRGYAQPIDSQRCLAFTTQAKGSSGYKDRKAIIPQMMFDTGHVRVLYHDGKVGEITILHSHLRYLAYEFTKYKGEPHE
jgi:hypothetical protein